MRAQLAQAPGALPELQAAELGAALAEQRRAWEAGLAAAAEQQRDAMGELEGVLGAATARQAAAVAKQQRAWEAAQAAAAERQAGGQRQVRWTEIFHKSVAAWRRLIFIPRRPSLRPLDMHAWHFL